MNQLCRPYECKLCDSKYKAQQVLNAHMRKVHKIENQQNRMKKRNNPCNETKNLSTIEEKDCSGENKPEYSNKSPISEEINGS